MNSYLSVATTGLALEVGVCTEDFGSWCVLVLGSG